MARNALVFLNIPVTDLDRSMTFFKGLGFAFNPQFTDENAACMVLSDKGFVMLLSEARFKDFARRPLADLRTTTSALFCVSAESRHDVDHVVDTALTTGGKPAAEPQDYGFMYGRSFYDPDGHHWEVMWMDPAHVQPQA